MTSWQWDVALGITALGLVILGVAWRSRTFTDPQCRACARDLRDAADRYSACPGCASDLTAPRAVRFRQRGIARDRGRFGAVILLLGVAAIIGVATSKPPPPPPGLTAPFATVPTDQLAAQVARQGVNPTFWAAVAQRVPTESWTDAETTAVVDALIAELRAQRETLIAAGLSEDDMDERGMTTAIRPFFNALFAHDRVVPADRSRALYHAMYGDDVRLRAEDLHPSSRHLRLSAGYGRGPFRLNAIPTTTLFWIDDLRLDGVSVLDSPTSMLNERSGFDRCDMVLMNLPPSADIECDVAYAVTERPAQSVQMIRQPGPPTNWPVADDAIRRTTLRHRVTKPPPPKLEWIDDPARDAEIRARIAIAPLHLYDQDGEHRLFTSIEFQPDPALGLYFEVAATIGGLRVPFGIHGIFSLTNPQPTEVAVRRIDVRLTQPVPMDVEHVTVTLTPYHLPPSMLRRDVSFWGRPLTIDVPLEHGTPGGAPDAGAPTDTEGSP